MDMESENALTRCVSANLAAGRYKVVHIIKTRRQTVRVKKCITTLLLVTTRQTQTDFYNDSTVNF